MKINVKYIDEADKEHTMEDKLKELGLHVEHSEDPNREPIDFEVRDEKGGLVATVWGSHPEQDVQIDCEHYGAEFDDDESVGYCPICGATCTWYWHVSADDGYTIKEQVPDQWEMPDKIGGAVGEYLDYLQKNW